MFASRRQFILSSSAAVLWRAPLIGVVDSFLTAGAYGQEPGNQLPVWETIIPEDWTTDVSSYDDAAGTGEGAYPNVIIFTEDEGTTIIGNVNSSNATAQTSGITLGQTLGVSEAAIDLGNLLVWILCPECALAGEAMTVLNVTVTAAGLAIDHYGHDPQRNDYQRVTVYNPTNRNALQQFKPGPQFSPNQAKLASLLQAQTGDYVSLTCAVAALTMSFERFQGAVAAYRAHPPKASEHPTPVELRASAQVTTPLLAQARALQQNATTCESLANQIASSCGTTATFLKSTASSWPAASQLNAADAAKSVMTLWQANRAQFAKVYQVTSGFLTLMDNAATSLSAAVASRATVSTISAPTLARQLSAIQGGMNSQSSSFGRLASSAAAVLGPNAQAPSNNTGNQNGNTGNRNGNPSNSGTKCAANLKCCGSVSNGLCTGTCAKVCSTGNH
jgi:hypothetical protein